jgi:hypothetical protein
MYRIEDFDATTLNLEIGYITYPNGDPTTTRVQISLHQGTPGTTKTIQDVIDSINGSLFGDAGKEWAAKVVPGASANAPSDSLACTVMEAFTATGASGQSILTITPSGGHSVNDDVAIGMLVVGTGVPAGSVVIAKPAANQVQIGDPATGLAVNLTGTASGAYTFAVSVGDDSLISAGAAARQKYGWVRCWGQSSPGILCFKGSYLDAFGKRPRDLWFTVGGPGSPRIAPNSFVIGNRRSVPESAGILMGGAPLKSGCVAAYSKAIYTLENRKDGSTGADEDYFLYVLNKKRGCISPYSVVAGDGWVGYMTAEGYVVTDGREERVITDDLHNPSSGQSVLQAAINKCLASVAKDTDSFYISAMIAKHQLHLCVAGSSSSTAPTVRYVYDFSRGAEASGLAEVLGPGGKPYPWSAQLGNAYSSMGQVNKSDGTHLYGIVDGDTLHPRLDEFDLGAYDQGKLATPVAASWSTGGAIIASSGAFTDVAIGAKIKATTGITGASAVTAKNAAETQLTISPTPTAPSSGTPEIYGKEIEPVAYMAMDQVGLVRQRKSCQRGTAMYKNPEGTMTLQHSRDYGRTTSTSYSLPTTTTAEQAKQRVETNRAPGDVVEFAVSHDGRFTTAANVPEFWGVEADVEIVESST